MYTAYEAAVHKAVVGPVVVLAALLDAVCRAWNSICDLADFVSGNPPRRPGSGLTELRVA